MMKRLALILIFLTLPVWAHAGHESGIVLTQQDDGIWQATWQMPYGMDWRGVLQRDGFVLLKNDMIVRPEIVSTPQEGSLQKVTLSFAVEKPNALRFAGGDAVGMITPLHGKQRGVVFADGRTTYALDQPARNGGTVYFLLALLLLIFLREYPRGLPVGA
jgi:hypothetical protein